VRPDPDFRGDAARVARGVHIAHQRSDDDVGSHGARWGGFAEANGPARGTVASGPDVRPWWRAHRPPLAIGAAALVLVVILLVVLIARGGGDDEAGGPTTVPAPTTAATPTTRAPLTRQVGVDGRDLWADTGIAVAAGDRIVIVADGQVVTD